MKAMIPFKGLSQYDPKIDSRLQGSACGPVTAAAILNFHNHTDNEVNDFYKTLGATAIGLFTWRMVRNFKKIGGRRFVASKVKSIESVKAELLAGRPVAMKFDRYFSFRWFSNPLYNYHWVPLIGFEEQGNDLVLYFHDNGKRNRPSKVQTVSYFPNRKFLTFVKIVPKQMD